MLHHIFAILIFTTAVGQCVRVGTARGPSERAVFDRLAAPPLSSWSSRTINATMLGHRGLYDDFISIWLVQLLADNQLKSYASAEKAYKIIESIIRHQPKLESVYLMSCLVLAIDFNRPDLCEPISLQGLKAFPNSWRIPMTQGFVAAFKLGNAAKAASYYAVASTRPNSPEWVQNYAKKLANQGVESGQDLNETIMLLKEVPGGTRLLELMRTRLHDQIPAPMQGGPETSTAPQAGEPH